LSTFRRDYIIIKYGRWRPWNEEILVTIRPIINPVPMYMQNKYLEIPANDKDVGFDLVAADWVPPYGKGQHTDFIFKVDRRYENVDSFRPET